VHVVHIRVNIAACKIFSKLLKAKTRVYVVHVVNVVTLRFYSLWQPANLPAAFECTSCTSCTCGKVTSSRS